VDREGGGKTELTSFFTVQAGGKKAEGKRRQPEKEGIGEGEERVKAATMKKKEGKKAD